jgi:hypothetical protein
MAQDFAAQDSDAWVRQGINVAERPARAAVLVGRGSVVFAFSITREMNNTRSVFQSARMAKAAMQRCVVKKARPVQRFQRENVSVCAIVRLILADATPKQSAARCGRRIAAPVFAKTFLKASYVLGEPCVCKASLVFHGALARFRDAFDLVETGSLLARTTHHAIKPTHKARPFAQPLATKIPIATAHWRNAAHRPASPVKPYAEQQANMIPVPLLSLRQPKNDVQKVFVVSSLLIKHVACAPATPNLPPPALALSPAYGVQASTVFSAEPPPAMVLVISQKAASAKKNNAASAPSYPRKAVASPMAKRCSPLLASKKASPVHRPCAVLATP